MDLGWGRLTCSSLWLRLFATPSPVCQGHVGNSEGRRSLRQLLKNAYVELKYGLAYFDFPWRLTGTQPRENTWLLEPTDRGPCLWCNRQTIISLKIRIFVLSLSHKSSAPDPYSFCLLIRVWNYICSYSCIRFRIRNADPSTKKLQKKQ